MAKNNSSIGSYNQNSNGYTVNKNPNMIGLLDIERIKANPLYQCTISGGTTLQKNGNDYLTIPSVISGIYDSDSNFTLSLGSEYTDTFEMPSVIDAVNDVTGFVSNFIGRTQFILKSTRMTEQRWTGSAYPEFNISINIPIVRKQDAAWSVIKFVTQATTGTLQDYARGGNQVKSTESSWLIYAPNSYTVHYKSSAQGEDYPTGAYTIELGKSPKCWFRMPNAIITSASCSISNKKYYDGNPVFVKVNIGFKFWRMPLLEDIVTWFPLAK